MSTLDENTNGLQQILNTVNELPSGGGSAAAFDLTAMGVPTITGTYTETNVDTSAMITALQQGRTLQLSFKVDIGAVFPIVANASNAVYSPVDDYWRITIFLGPPQLAPNVDIEILPSGISAQVCTP